jgi:hypothetical protein
LKLAEKQNPKLRLEDRTEIVWQGVFGHCYSAIIRADHFEIAWTRNAHERPDRSEDVRMAITNWQSVSAAKVVQRKAGQVRTLVELPVCLPPNQLAAAAQLRQPIFPLLSAPC